MKILARIRPKGWMDILALNWERKLISTLYGWITYIERTHDGQWEIWIRDEDHVDAVYVDLIQKGD